MGVGRGIGGKRLTPEDALAVVILRHCYQLDRRSAGALPTWERELLIEGGKRLLNIGQPADEGLPEAGLSASELHVLTTPGAG